MGKIKSEKELIKWFLGHITDGGEPYILDKNQAKVILDEHKHALVVARAGSGKTRTLVAKVVYLLKSCNIKESEIVVFAFNRKAAEEVNARIASISFDGSPLFAKPPKIATTFHAFAYRVLGGKKELENRIVSESENSLIIRKILNNNLPAVAKERLSVLPKKEREEELISLEKTIMQFIVRAEQKFFQDYKILQIKIEEQPSSENKNLLKMLFKYLSKYHLELKKQNLLNFNQLMNKASMHLKNENFPYKYILVDEYQDFSLLFMEEIKALMSRCKNPHLIAVGDDWQAINRFAGSDVKYFLDFEKYFKNNSVKLFIPTNYRSSKKIVKNANYFMSAAIRDYKGCTSGNKKLKGKIYVKDVTKNKNPLYEEYLRIICKIIKENPNKTIKILHRNNELNFKRISLKQFCENITACLLAKNILTEETKELITWSTIHKSKGLEADIVILLEIDSGKFPSKDKTGGLYQIFGDNIATNLEDEIRLFYVAMTRAKEKLFILSKTTKYTKENKRYNFLSYLESDELEWL